MKYFRVSLFCLCVALLMTTRAEAQVWKNIIPMKSTRLDVEKLLGNAEKSYGVIYELPDGNLFVEYSSGPCRADRKGGWNVAENIVISFRFTPTVKQRIADLVIDRSKFKEVIDQHSNGFIHHLINDEDGVMYELQQGQVEYVEYYPPSKYDHLQCGNGPM